jgi:TPR repeat protein
MFYAKKLVQLAAILFTLILGAQTSTEDQLIHRELVAKAESGDLRSQVQLGNRFMLGNARAGVVKDLAAAESWFLKAAAQGYAPAFERLAEIHFDEASRLSSMGRVETEELVEGYKWSILAGSMSAPRTLSQSTKNEAARRAEAWRMQAGLPAMSKSPASRSSPFSGGSGMVGSSGAGAASSRANAIVIGKGVRLDFERQKVVGTIWSEMKKSFSLSLDGDLQPGLSGLALQDNEECFDAFYRYVAQHPAARSIPTTERCPDCRGSGTIIVYSKDPRTPLFYEKTTCQACMGGGKQDLMVSYTIICDASKVPVKAETPRMRNVKALMTRAAAGDSDARLKFAGYLLKGDEGVVRDVNKAKVMYRELVLVGVSDALIGLRDAIDLSVGKTVDDKRFMTILEGVSSSLNASTPDKPKSKGPTVDELSRRMDTVGNALGARPSFELSGFGASAVSSGEARTSATEKKQELGYIDDTTQKLLVAEFTTLFRTKLLVASHLSYPGLVNGLASQPRTSGDYKALLLDWLAQGKRDYVDAGTVKQLKVNAANLDSMSLGFLAGITEEGLGVAPNPLAAYVLYKMAYVQSGKPEFMAQVRRLEGAVNKDLAQKVLFEFENLRRTKSPLDTYVESVLSLK